MESGVLYIPAMTGLTGFPHPNKMISSNANTHHPLFHNLPGVLDIHVSAVSRNL